MCPGLLPALQLECGLDLMLSHFQLLNSLPVLLSDRLFNVDWQECFCRWYVWGSSGACRLNSSEKCSNYLTSCSWTVHMVRDSPCLSLTGLSICWYLPASSLVMSYSSCFSVMQLLPPVLPGCQYALSLLLLYFSSPLCKLHCTLSVLLPLLPWFYCLLFRAAFLCFLTLIFCKVVGVIHSLSCMISLHTTSSQVLVHIC